MNEDPAQNRKKVFTVLLKIFGYVTLCSAFIAVVLISYWNVQNPQVLVAKNTPFSVRPPVNAAGNTEYVHINYCKNVKAKGVVTLRLVGKKSVIRLPWPVDNSEPQCLDTEIPIVLPTYAIDDTYYFDFSISYKVNPIKITVVNLRSEKFTINSAGIRVE